MHFGWASRSLSLQRGANYACTIDKSVHVVQLEPLQADCHLMLLLLSARHSCWHASTGGWLVLDGRTAARRLNAATGIRTVKTVIMVADHDVRLDLDLTQHPVGLLEHFCRVTCPLQLNRLLLLFLLRQSGLRLLTLVHLGWLWRTAIHLNPNISFTRVIFLVSGPEEFTLM